MNSIVLGSPLISGVVAMLIVLVVGDFASTFFYHVPQHVWGKLHLRTHHDRKRSYWDHAVLSRNPGVLLDGLLGALPYIAVACAASVISIEGAVLDEGAEGIGGIAFCPLAQGLLTDRYLKGIPEDSRASKPHGFLKKHDISEKRLTQIRASSRSSRMLPRSITHHSHQKNCT